MTFRLHSIPFYRCYSNLSDNFSTALRRSSDASSIEENEKYENAYRNLQRYNNLSLQFTSALATNNQHNNNNHSTEDTPINEIDNLVLDLGNVFNWYRGSLVIKDSKVDIFGIAYFFGN